MRNFWGYYDNGQYKVGCSGRSMYLYDSADRELARFKDIPYAYQGAFHPRSNRFVLRSTVGKLAVYDCDEKKLLTKFRFSDVDHSQDHGFCFSPEGEYFWNIELAESGLHSRLTLYETKTFSPVKRLFEEEKALVLSHIEYNSAQKQYFVLYAMRDSQGLCSRHYIGVLNGDALVPVQELTAKEHYFLRSYQSLQLYGFTSKAMEWSGLHYTGYTNDEILELKNRNIDMATFPQLAERVVK